MALNCIIDDSALVAGIRDHTRDNLKQWIHDGAINLFVPLYTLEQLNVLRSKNVPTSNDARKALEWLDHITSWTENKLVGRVELQGPDDQYKTWQEVEKYLLPDTPFGGHATSGNVDELTGTLNDRPTVDTLRLEDSQTSESHKKQNGVRGSVDRPHAADLDGSSDAPVTYSAPNLTMTIPPRVRPLLNFVVWRTHNQDTTIQASAHYILLTDDTVTQRQAQKFGVRAKLLSQVRGIVARDRSKSGPEQGLIDKQVSPEALTDNNPQKVDEEEDDEEEIVYKPVTRPKSSRSANDEPYVLDPDHFGRSPNPGSGFTPTELQDNLPANTRGGMRVSAHARRGRVARGQARGASNHQRGSSAPQPITTSTHTRAGRPPQSPRASAAPIRGAPTSPRRHATSPRARHSTPVGDRGRGQNMNSPIDPDSYARPPPPNGRGRGRAAYRRLWEPT